MTSEINIKLIRTDSNNPHFIGLVEKLDADLATTDGDEHAFYHQFNQITLLRRVVVAVEDNEAVACGAIKEYDPGVMEIKRMYTEPGKRGFGIAGRILRELEQWSVELNASRCILETGMRQPMAIALYKKSGYVIIPNYGQYAGAENSVCFEKIIFK